MKNILGLLCLLAGQAIFAQQASEEITQKFHQFDFWLGTWDVYKYGTDTLVGHSRIESIIDSLGVLENYTVPIGQFQGKSLNKYNPAKDRWEQYWIDNTGLTLHLSGRLADGKMVLKDTESGDSARGLNKIVWEPLPGGSVRQTWSVSSDKGQSWSVVFDGEYKMRKPEILGLRTCIYRVGNLETAKKWYATAFRIKPYWEDPSYVGFNIGGFELGLLEGDDPASEKAESVVTYWGVDDIHRTYGHILASGATALEKPESVGGPLMVATVKDPWGNVIGLIYNPAFQLK